MGAITRLKVQTAAFVALSIWNFITPIYSHGHHTEAVMNASGAAFFVLAMNNCKTIRREQEREKVSRWD